MVKIGLSSIWLSLKKVNIVSIILTKSGLKSVDVIRWGMENDVC